MRSCLPAWLCASLLTSIACCPVNAMDEPAAVDSSDQGLVRLRNYLDEFDSLRADFRQEVINSDMDQFHIAIDDFLAQICPPGLKFVYIIA